MEQERSEGYFALTSYRNGKLELDMSLTQYEKLNKVSINTEGSSLSSLAEQDPSRAYSLLKKMVGSIATGACGVSLGGVERSSAQQDGVEVTEALAKSLLMEKMPEIYERRIELSVGVYPSESDVEMFGELAGDRLPVLEVVVEPPRYAD